MNEENRKKGFKRYGIYILALVVVLIVSLLAVSYSYLSFLDTSTSTSSTLIGTTECLDVTPSYEGVATLTNKYPLTDDAAVAGKVTPITLTIKNNCTGGNPIPYSVIFTSLDNGSKYIGDGNVKIKITKTIGDTTTNPKDTGLLNTMTKLASSKTTYGLLDSRLKADTKLTSYTTKTPYVVEGSQEIKPNETIIYKIYLWVNDPGSEDNTTQDKNFASVTSIVVNNPESLT